jgi:hypothetical protein
VTKPREALTSAWAEAQMRVQAQSRALPNVFNVENVVKRLIWTRMTSDEADKRPDVDAFNRALAEGKPGTTSKQITATFIGRFNCKPRSSSPTRRRVIEIEQVSGLEVTAVKPGDR